MASMNMVVLMGNLVGDVEGKTLPSGSEVANFRIAVNEDYTGKDGKKVESAVFVDVEAWGKQAGPCRQYLKKGSPVMVEGRLKLDQWQGKDGEKRSKLLVRADRVQFLGGAAGGKKAPGTDGEVRPGNDKAGKQPPTQIEEWPDDPQGAAEGEPLPF